MREVLKIIYANAYHKNCNGDLKFSYDFYKKGSEGCGPHQTWMDHIYKFMEKYEKF